MKNLLAIVPMIIGLFSDNHGFAQTPDDCDPSLIISIIEEWSDTPMSSALDIYDLEETEGKDIVYWYVLVSNARADLEANWPSIASCPDSLVEMYMAEIRIIGLIEDLLFLSLATASGVSPESDAMLSRKDELAQQIIDEFDLVINLVEENQ